MARFQKQFHLALLTGLVLVAAAAVIFAAVKFTNSRSQAGELTACTSTGATHTIVIKDNMMTPDHIAAPRCDTLTITNDDTINRLIAFGPHEHHVAYDGVTERLLLQGESVTVTLNKAGNFQFHDHLHDEVRGTFTVTGQ